MPEAIIVILAVVILIASVMPYIWVMKTYKMTKEIHKKLFDSKE